ncbi:SDR family oxidoreductase [Paraliomyxa miuraensis]|uniref:SDR family oxidoreductase n=1 Tax=Paraliomyxa miuraensis TaxID=376150 RepID=UPI0022553269|nr:SDR family oxidoreductase [Paraliomyxa miuraensis]MCX4239129.1 SDR family oxidoreductase [Paraliomyxa miuraensis]
MSEPRPDSPRDAVMITGASTGIGRATALHLAGKGLRVFAGIRKPADGEALVKALGGEGAGGSIEPLVVDVAEGDSIASAVTELSERLEGSRLIGLVNNAGIAVGGPQEFMPLEEWRRQFEVNVFGLVDTTQKVLPYLMRSHGRVVNIGSIGGRVATPLMGPYAATKFAVRAITDALRMELRPFGVWAACVEPGAIKTEIWKKADEQIADYAANTPAEEQARYQPGFEALIRFSARGAKQGAEPIAVARKVEHALLASRPRTSYLVGVDAHVLATLRWLLSDRALEWVMGKMM